MGVLTKILNRIDGSLIFEAKVDGETESIRLGLAARLKFQKDADLRYANLRYANLQDADLDFSSGITFRCSSFGFKCDFRLIAQIMCHVSRLKSDDPKADKIIKEVGTRWGNEFCQFRSDVEPIQIESPTTGNWPHGYDD